MIRQSEGWELSGTTSGPHLFPSTQERFVLVHQKLPLLGHFFNFFQFHVYVVYAAVRPYVYRIIELAPVCERKKKILFRRILLEIILLIDSGTIQLT